ncbi:MAG: hypothetical protein WBV77_04485 [Solirubrobacteraceae bacterium]
MRTKLTLISIVAVVCVSVCPAYASAKLTASEVASSLLLSQTPTMKGTGEVTFETALGTELEVVNVMEGRPRAAGFNESHAPACFTPCTPADIEAEQIREHELQQETYLVVMRGRTFAPSEHLRRGASEVTGNVMTVAVNAHTGQRTSMEIGGESPPPEASALGPVTLLVVPAGTTAQAASRKVCYAHRVGRRLRCNR